MRVCTINNRSNLNRFRWRLNSLSASLACCVLLAVAASPVEAKVLQWKLEEHGQYRIVGQRITRQKVGDSSWTETVESTTLWDVVAIDEEGFRIKQKLESVKHGLQFPSSVSISYDSSVAGDAKGAALALAKRWEPQLKQEQVIRLAPTGQQSVLDVEATVATSTAAPKPTANIANDWRAIPKPLKTNAELMLPTGDVPTGYEWSDARSIPWNDVPDSLRFTTLYRYAGEEQKGEQTLDRIQVVTQWEELVRPDAENNLVIDRQSGSGLIQFDADAGHLVSSDRTQDLVVRLLRADAEAQLVEVSTTLKVTCQPVPAETESEEVVK